MSALDLGRLQPKQAEVFTSQATEILFGGSRGPGKSHLLRIAAIMWAIDIPGLQVYLFRRQYNDLVANHLDGPRGFRNLLAPWVESGLCKINSSAFEIRFTFNGSIIRLRHLQRDTDIYDYQGQEFHVLLIDEGTHFPEWVYRFMRASVRIGGLDIPTKYKGLFPRIIIGANPGNIGHAWVKANFIDIAPPNSIIQMPPEEGGFRRQFIPAFLSDNFVLRENDPYYADRLRGMGDPALVEAMLNGDWSQVSGGAIDDVWKPQHVICRPFKIPLEWRIDRAYDWGETKPWACVWFAEANGEEVEVERLERQVDGSIKPVKVKWAPYRGTVFAIREVYGWNGKANEGNRMTIREQAEVIKGVDREFREDGHIVKAGPADSSIWDARNNTKSFADEFKDLGVHWVKADKSPGSRVMGLSTVRRMLKAAADVPMEHPAFIVFDTCSQIIRTLPILPRAQHNPDDVDTNAEDHVWDCCRYRCTSKKKILDTVKVVGF